MNRRELLKSASFGLISALSSKATLENIEDIRVLRTIEKDITVGNEVLSHLRNIPPQEDPEDSESIRSAIIYLTNSLDETSSEYRTQGGLNTHINKVNMITILLPLSVYTGSAAINELSQAFNTEPAKSPPRSIPNS